MSLWFSKMYPNITVRHGLAAAHRIPKGMPKACLSECEAREPTHAALQASKPLYLQKRVHALQIRPVLLVLFVQLCSDV